MPQLLSDPFLLWPTANSVRVVWFTEQPGSNHRVCYGHPLREVCASTVRLSRMAEDAASYVGLQSGQAETYAQRTNRSIFRHEAEVVGLLPGVRLPYRVVSTLEGIVVWSDEFTLTPTPAPGKPLQILLTSDHQVLPMVPANLQMVQAQGLLDAVFFAGDLVNMPDRASEWFDDNRGGAFFPCLQGRASRLLGGETYRGGALIQHAPLFPAIGNHEVMGVYDPEAPALNLSGARPSHALASNLTTEQSQDQSFNTLSYQEIFAAPPYYAVTFGDVRLVVLYATRVWRSPEPGTTGKYSERPEDPQAHWGHGEFIFEPVAAGSPQYDWFSDELQRPEFQQAKYRVVMLHHPFHSLGGNVVPAFTDPVKVIGADGQRYEYPRAQDHLIRDLKPLIEAAGVELVLYGHSHLWNRFTSASGTHYLETSNVGNTFGAHPEGSARGPLPVGEDYRATGDPNGLIPVVPTIAPLRDEHGVPQPFIASNEITVFSILDTGNGTVASYRFDTRFPGLPVVKFDEFVLCTHPPASLPE